MYRNTLFLSALAVFSLLASGTDVLAQYYRNPYGAVAYNPYMRSYYARPPAYNPYTRMGVSTAAYNPYTGGGAAHQSYYNPYTGTAAHATEYHNPYTGNTGYHYSYRRR